jgi:hypothetical protein
MDRRLRIINPNFANLFLITRRFFDEVKLAKFGAI